MSYAGAVNRAPFVAALLSMMGCTSSHVVTVEVRTDLIPGVELTRVRTRALDLPVVDHEVDPAASWFEGVVVGELVLPDGPQELTVELLDADGLPVDARPVELELARDATVTVVFTRDCPDVSCPGADDDASASACFGGGCVAPSCTLQTPASCDIGECSANADCGDPERPRCVDVRCLAGACLYPPNDLRCGSEELICHPELGCRPAANVHRCAAPDEDTVLLLTFDDETAADAVGRNPGMIVGASEWTDGPLGCERALTLSSAEDSQVEIPDSMDWHLEEGAIDFWFRHPAALRRAAGIVSRELRAFGNGHFSALLSENDEVLVRFENAAELQSVACGPPVTPDEWHHVGINFGPEGLELWVDGERSVRDDAAVYTDGEGALTFPCAMGTTVGLRPADSLPWVLGASGLRTDDGATWTDFLSGGAIDHFRISRVRRDFRSP